MAWALWRIAAVLERLPILRVLAKLLQRWVIGRVAHESPKQIGRFVQMVSSVTHEDRESRLFVVRHPPPSKWEREQAVMRLAEYRTQMNAVRLRRVG